MEKLAPFLKLAYGSNEGLICLSKRDPTKDKNDRTAWTDQFFRWPDDFDNIVEWVDRFYTSHNLYYCPNLFAQPRRQKDAVLKAHTAWADLDACHPDKLLVEPSLTVESSPGRYQALWVLKGGAPLDAEDISRRIAYHHADDGADKSGWDLTQALRIPGSYNYKYGGVGAAPTVSILRASGVSYDVADFDCYPKVKGYEWIEVPFPDELPDRAEVLAQYASRLDPHASYLLLAEPKQDWSAALWQLELLLFDSGMSAAEVFTIVKDAPCNKYARDNRSEAYLWRDVCRARKESIERQAALYPQLPVEVSAKLLTDDEVKQVVTEPTLVEEYIDWAKSLGDAAWQYHQAGIFTVLSSLLSTYVILPTSFGHVKLNLWFLIMANTTLTRKTTAMDVAMDLLYEVDPDAVLATDGSIEGLFSGLATRPGRSSIFLRDEFSGMMEAMAKKDYYAGMAESLTKLYDGKYLKRVLKRETIEVRDPVFIMFTGGIKNRLLELLSYDQVLSGFLPRFIFITAEADVTKLKPLGPPTMLEDRKKQEILTKLRRVFNHYSAPVQINVNGKTVAQKRVWRAEMTEEAWQRYNLFEATMLQEAIHSAHADVVIPTMDRLAKSGLKAAVMFAALRCPSDKIVVELSDMLHAFFYVDQWRSYALQILGEVGKSGYERQIDNIVRSIEKQPGIPRGTIMQVYRLNSKAADDILTTLEQRGIIRKEKEGRSERLFLTSYVPLEPTPNGKGKVHVKG